MNKKEHKFENISYRVEESIAIISIERPKAMNSLNTKTLLELKNAIESAENDQEVRCLILTGHGEKVFVAGADVKEMADKSVPEAKDYSKLGHDITRELETMSLPSIAAINGLALGAGNELALACDIRVASEEAEFGQPEINLGIVPGFGGTQRVPKKVGFSHAIDMILTGKRIAAKEAKEIGLVSEVVSSDELMERVKKKATKIANMSKIAIETAKNLVIMSAEMGLESGLELENRAFSNLFGTKDQKIGMKAFLDKSKPQFEDR